MKIVNQNDPPQHRSSTHSNGTSTASCALQIDEGNVAKEHVLDPTYSSDIIQDYLEDNIPATNQTEIRNGVGFCQEDIPEQEPIKIVTDTKDPDRFIRKQNINDNRNV